MNASVITHYGPVDPWVRVELQVSFDSYDAAIWLWQRISL